MRRSGLSQHTIDKIQAGHAVRPAILARLLEALNAESSGAKVSRGRLPTCAKATNDGSSRQRRRS
jgi:hypothetical protein